MGMKMPRRLKRGLGDHYVLNIGLVDAHPPEVLEEYHLAVHHGPAGGAVVPAGPLDEHAEQRVPDELGADEVPSARLADVDRLEPARYLVPVERRRVPRLPVLRPRRCGPAG
ncbi:hypothetical protein B296_00058290 [Ensete ventricosum]|uniref:Uncharacterized protein n=1 Tax=Ensete ventricosum TaxID=4639 RepID=A0A426WXB7_ENSVE|nr:hypothetical protein B296_00058290 [Ensete ventricosum]